MNVLVACEMSARVRDAYRKRGHNAWSCDLLPTLGDPKWHLQIDVGRVMSRHSSLVDALDTWGVPKTWDLMVAFPPCTYLCSSGLHWNKRRPERAAKTETALRFVKLLMDANIPKIAIENPVGCISTRIRPPDQWVQPWQFGHGYTKKTGLWLKNLPKLKPTNVVPGREPLIWKMGPSKDRAMKRSLTPQGLADAMAEQWS